MATGISPLAANSAARTRFRLLAAGLARVAYEACPSKQRAQEKPDALRTRSAPLVRRDGEISNAVSTKRRSELFLRKGLDRISGDLPVGQISYGVTRTHLQLLRVAVR